MTLDEAISHAEMIANNTSCRMGGVDCAKEHKQLAEWLKELKQWRDSGMHLSIGDRNSQ